MHIFKYSQRKGTKAASMEKQIDGNIKEFRSQKLIDLSDENEKEYNKSYIGEKVEVLFEEKKDGFYKGHTKNYILIYLPEKDIPKKIQEEIKDKVIKVKCVIVEENYILATL